jgi:hypothetical protein
MESRLLLDIVVREGSAILELLSSKDQTLLVRRLQGWDCMSILDVLIDLDGPGSAIEACPW